MKAHDGCEWFLEVIEDAVKGYPGRYVDCTFNPDPFPVQIE